jgi:PASTA domain/Divergent InlB B-repeat domain
MTMRPRPALLSILVGLLGLAVMLCLPAAASAAVPVVTKTSVQVTGFTTATFIGDIDPQLDATTTYAVEWDVQSSTWCTSGGTSGLPANTTSPTPLGSNSALEVGVNLTGLTRFTTYCGRFIATNGDGEGDGPQVTWQQDPPLVDTLDAFATSAATATVDVAINPEGNDTLYDVEYGLASSTWCTSNGTSGPTPHISDNFDLGFTDSTVHDVSVKLFQLQTGAEYCARGAAFSAGGEAFATTFVTFTVDKAGATTGTASPTGGSTATVTGVVNPNGKTTSYAVQYGLSSSDWCTSGGTSGLPANTTAPATLGFTDEVYHDVSVDLTGLTAASDYCARLIATNANGEADGAQVSWTQGETPDVLTFDTYSTGATTATVEGLVDPHGEATTYAAQYDLASSEWCTSGGASGSPAHTTAGSDPIPVDDFVSVDLTGLTEGTNYCAQLTATDANGDAEGGQVPWTQGAAAADTFDANPTGLTTATIDGDVNPAGQSTSYAVEYDFASSDWCLSGGLSGTPGSTSTSHDLAATDGTFHDVSIDLTGLTPGAEYCAEIVATNGTGSSPIDDGDQAFWDQPTQPSKDTLTVTRGGPGTGTVTSSPAGIDCGSTCSSSFDSGTQVTLSATAAAGSVFEGWSGGGCGPASGTGTCKVTLSADTTVNAIFGTPALITRTLSVSLAGTGSGTVTSSPAGISCFATCSSQFNAGTQVTLTATADSGSTLAGWSGGGCSGTGVCVITLNGDTNVTATFSASSPAPPPVTKCVVPKLRAKTLPAAKRSIKSHHCGVGKITKVASSPKNRGHVISQSPKPGKHLRKGAKVALKVGK